MSILQIERVSKAFGADILFDPFSAQLARGDRVALIGDNGVGKSTLLQIIAGIEPPTEGDVRRIGPVKVSYLPQAARLGSGGTLRDAMEQPFRDLRRLEQTLRQMERSIAAGDDGPDTLHAYDETLHQFEHAGGYEIDARLRATLAGVGIGQDHLDQPADRLSGGEEARAALARVLLEAPDLLLLDEPTNHLDFEALDWLEETLRLLPGGLILVSHDRHLLDRVANCTWEMAFEEVTVYDTGYSTSRSQRAADRERRLEAYQQQEKTVERYRDFIRRHKAGQKVGQAKDREKKLERLEEARIERPRDAQRISLQIPLSEPSGKRVLSLHGLKIGYDEALLILPDIEVYRGEKVAIIGPNGCGKTTLLNTLLGEHWPLAGTIELGHNVKSAVFRQRQEGLHERETVLQAVLSRASLSVSEARGLLGRYLFSGDDVEKRMIDLSGGERSRVALALLSLAKGNLLVLDEPTNHLDLASQEILEDALRSYPGTLLLVSHDRALLEAITSQVWLIENRQLRVYGEGYAKFRDRRTEAASGGERRDSADRPSSSGASSEPSRPKQVARDREAARRRLEDEIEALEGELQTLELQLTSASSAGDTEQVAVLGTTHAGVQRTLDEMYRKWNLLAFEDGAEA
jgi:ATP-binding cassette, subfamily F, member 3